MRCMSQTPAPVRAVLVLLLGALLGCGEARGMDPAPNPEVTAANAAVRLVAEAEADLLLDVTKQSSDDEGAGPGCRGRARGGGRLR